MTEGINWGSIADWVSGLGSLSAGVIALYLARASERIRLKGYCGIRLLLVGGTSDELVSLAVTNVGTRATVVNNIGISVGRRKGKRYAVINAAKGAYSDGIPYALADGQQAHWGIPMGKNKQWLRDLCGKLIQTEQDVHTLRFHVYTNHGAELTLKPEEAMLKALQDVLVEERTAAKEPKI